MARHYDNEHSNRKFNKQHRYVGHRRNAQGYRYSDGELDEQAKRRQFVQNKQQKAVMYFDYDDED